MINLTPEEIRAIISATMLQHNEGKLFRTMVLGSKFEPMKMDAHEALLEAGRRIIKASSEKEYRVMDQWMRDNALAATTMQWREVPKDDVG